MSFSRVLCCTTLLTLALAGCGGDEAAPPAIFAPLHYEYLNKLRLNVGSIDVQNHEAPPGPDDVSARSPVTPTQALQQIAHDRLFAAGLQGSAAFVIDQASILRGDSGALYGQMAVHLEILTAAGARAAYAEARVAQQHLPGSEDENLQTELYDITRKMADAMNVELEYQMKRALGDVLVPDGVVPSAVIAAPLGSQIPAAPAPAPAAVPQMSPPPGYLQLPAGQ